MIADDFRVYMRSLLGIELSLKSYVPKGLPFFLSELYDYRTTTFGNHDLLICLPRGEEQPTPAQLADHEARLRNASGREVVFVFSELDSWNRRRLIEGRLSFAVPGTQLYLPSLLIDLREQFSQVRKKPSCLSWPAQVIIIRWMLDSSIEGKAVRELSKLIGYSPISISRGLDELIVLELARTNKGKTKPLIFEKTKSELWNAALPYMRSPVKERIDWPQSSMMNDWPKAGMSALATMSDLNDDSRECRAVSRTVFLKQFSLNDSISMSHGSNANAYLELWAYSPIVQYCQSTLGAVDPYSLYLSLRTNNDERVLKALDDLMKGIL
jgi:hypothetical protein